MAGETVFMLGPVEFKVINAPSVFEKSGEANYRKLERMGQTDALQHTGSLPSVYNLSYEIHARIHGEKIREQPETLDDLMENGDVLYLMGGDGKRYGRVVIKSHKWSIVKTSQGATLHVKGQLVLWEYTEE